MAEHVQARSFVGCPFTQHLLRELKAFVAVTNLTSNVLRWLPCAQQKQQFFQVAHTHSGKTFSRTAWTLDSISRNFSEVEAADCDVCTAWTK